MELLPFLIATVFIGFLGAAIGSFLNVVVYRTVQGEQWVSGRSKCDHCGKLLQWFDNIPVLSYVLLRGKTRCCAKHLSMTHPIVELLSATLFVWWYSIGVFFIFKLTSHPYSILQPLFWLVVGVLLLGIVVADVLYYIIPDVFTFTLTILVLLYRVLLLTSGKLQWSDFLLSLGSAAVLTIFFALLWLGTGKKGFGLGDVKYALPMGLLLGWPRIAVGVMAAFVIGAGVGIILLLTGKKKWRQAVPFGPFLVIGTSLALLWGYPLVEWYVNLLQ